MKKQINMAQIAESAEALGLTLQHDAGGYTIVKEGARVFPASPNAPSQPKQACIGFLLGVCWEREQL